MAPPDQPVRTPTSGEILEIAEKYSLTLEDEEVSTLKRHIDRLADSYSTLQTTESARWDTEYSDREINGSPDPDTDAYNAVITRCRIPGADQGPLTDWEIGVKDNIPIHGVEMTAGSTLLPNYVPQRDATVVERLLDAGATITATLNMEDLAFSGSGELSAHGPVLNPRNPKYLAGGSSGGSAVAVFTGLVDAALGTDQGGSSRIPASWCGVVGIKPTYGLVPYTGIIPRDPSIDHTGIFTRTVKESAQILEIVAGQDPLDPRQNHRSTEQYSQDFDMDPTDISIAIVEEGVGRDESDEAVDATVKDALDTFEDSGVDVGSVSIPWHDIGASILMAIVIEGSAAMVRDESVGHFVRGFYDTQFATAFGRARRTNADDFPPMQKLALIFGDYLAENYQGRYYQKAHNLVRQLANEYDEALKDVDVLAMPTTPHTAHPVETDQSLETLMNRAFSMNGNTSPFNASGHPAITIPCGHANGLPVGLMFVGRHFDESTLLAVADTFEQQIGNWDSLYSDID